MPDFRISNLMFAVVFIKVWIVRFKSRSYWLTTLFEIKMRKGYLIRTSSIKVGRVIEVL